MREYSIIIEREGDNLKCLAPPKPMWPIYATAAGSGAVLLLLFIEMFSMAYDEWSRFHNIVMPIIFTAVWLALAIPIVLVVIGSYKRRKMLCGIVIESGIARIYTPEQSLSMKEVQQIDIIGAYLRASIKMQKIAGMTHCANLHLALRKGKNILAMINQPAHDLKRIVDTINSMVHIDQYNGFEVVVGRTPAMPVEGITTTASLAVPVDCPASPVLPEQKP